MPKTTVLNKYDKEIDFNAAVEIMDDELREQLHMDSTSWMAQDFFDIYCRLHLAKLGEEFEPDKKNPTW